MAAKKKAQKKKTAAKPAVKAKATDAHPLFDKR